MQKLHRTTLQVCSSCKKDKCICLYYEGGCMCGFQTINLDRWEIASRRSRSQEGQGQVRRSRIRPGWNTFWRRLSPRRTSRSSSRNTTRSCRQARFGHRFFKLSAFPSSKVSSSSQFEYAWCLVRSRYPADIKKGIILLEDLFKVAHLILLLFRMANITFFHTVRTFGLLQ